MIEIYWCANAQNIGMNDGIIWYMSHDKKIMTDYFPALEDPIDSQALKNYWHIRQALKNYDKLTTNPKNYTNRYIKIMSLYE